MATTQARAEVATASGEASPPDNGPDQSQVDYLTAIADQKDAVVASLKDNVKALQAAIKEHEAEAKQARIDARNAGGK